MLVLLLTLSTLQDTIAGEVGIEGVQACPISFLQFGFLGFLLLFVSAVPCHASAVAVLRVTFSIPDLAVATAVQVAEPCFGRGSTFG